MTASKEYRKRGAAKAFVLMIFLVAVFWLVRFTPVREYLAVEKMAQILAIAGHWAPMAHILLYAAGVCIFLPGTLLAAIGAAIFGPYYGFVFVWIGAMIGASLAFFIGRYLGRDFAASLIGSKLKKYDDTIARNGFATVLYLRLIYFPFTPMNFAMGLTNVRFRDYFFGTAVGILAGTFIFTFFIGTIKEIWVSGDWKGLLSWNVCLAVGLFIFSCLVPTIIGNLPIGKLMGKGKNGEM